MPRAASNSARKSISDDEIMSGIVAGNDGAFVLLMRRFNRPLYRVARSILRDDIEAEDALQDAYLQAFRSAKLFRGESKLLTWLMRIVVNESIARKRKTARRAEIIPLGTTLEEYERNGEINNTTYQEPERAAMLAEARGFLEKKIDTLPQAFRIVFVLRAVEEMTVEEVSAALNIPEATVRTRYFRAKSLLREALSRDFDFALEDAFSFDGVRCDRIVDRVLRKFAADRYTKGQ